MNGDTDDAISDTVLYQRAELPLCMAGPCKLSLLHLFCLQVRTGHWRMHLDGKPQGLEPKESKRGDPAHVEPRQRMPCVALVTGDSKRAHASGWYAEATQGKRRHPAHRTHGTKAGQTHL